MSKLIWFQDTSSLQWSVCAATPQEDSKLTWQTSVNIRVSPDPEAGRPLRPPFLKRPPASCRVNSDLSRYFVRTAGRAAADYRARRVSWRSSAAVARRRRSGRGDRTEEPIKVVRSRTTLTEKGRFPPHSNSLIAETTHSVILIRKPLYNK